MREVLTTDCVPDAQRLPYWTDVICDVFVQLDCSAESDGGFYGTVKRERLAHLRLSEVESAPQTVRRTPKQIARATEDFFLVSMQRKGCGVVRQDGRAAHLSPGDFALYDSTRPYELLFEEPFSQFVLMLPGDTLRTYLKNTAELTATAVSGRTGAGHLLINMIDTLQRDMHALQPASAAAVADGAVNILVAGLRTLPLAQQVGIPDLTRYHIARIKNFIITHLGDEHLSVAQVAQALRVSESHIHRLFQNEPQPLAQYIWSERLEACKRDLADPAFAGLSIGAIALERGFKSATHFSRTFHERFGLTPREYRHQSVGCLGE